MGVPVVFVYADGQVGLSTLERELPTYRRMRPVPSPLFVPDDPDSRARIDVESFSIIGRMFDGRPIYAVDGYAVKEAQRVTLATKELSLDDVRDEQRSEVRRLIQRTYQDVFIALDFWQGIVPFSLEEIDAGLDKQSITKYATRELVAVPTRCL